jgi:N-acetylglucosamine-6-sulfatase
VRRRIGLVAAGLIAVAALVVVVVAVGDDERPQPRAGAPNLLLITSDDQAMNSFKRRYMPQTFRAFDAGGSRFSDAIATPPLCCPARAGMLTGQYPHNHGVFNNHPGYPDLVDPQDVLPAWLQRAGYTTGYVGRYLNGYTDAEGAEPAPGFDSWFAIQSTDYFDYEISANGDLEERGSEADQHATLVATEAAVEFIEESLDGDRPFFLWLSYTAPHDRPGNGGPCPNRTPQPSEPASYRRFAGEPLPRGPAFDEGDVSDKPSDIRDLPRLDAKAIDRIAVRWRCTLATMAEVDDGIGEVFAALEERGATDDTVAAFLSDNGAFFGEHRVDRGKAAPYPPAVRIPMAIRVPPRLRESAPGRIDELVSTIDIPATLLDYAGGMPCASSDECRRMDGRSLRGLLAGADREWPRDRAILIELEPSCFPFQAALTRRFLYSRPTPGAEAKCPTSSELYDLRSDPFELDNLIAPAAGRVPSVQAARDDLEARLATLSECTGIEGRDEPIDRPFCE